MNILERADKFAEGKANEAITKAIAQAFVEGYKAGYHDREMEIPADLRDEKTEYVDLGLPSGTLWAADYEKADGKYKDYTYDELLYVKLPTEEQCKELFNCCKIEYDINNYYDFCKVTFLGPNGNRLVFNRTGYISVTGNVDTWHAYIWISDDSSTANTSHIYNTWKYRNAKYGGYEFKQMFSGFRMKVRTVR